MSTIGQRERATQNRVVKLFRNQLSYTYYGDWQDRTDNSNIEGAYLRGWHSRNNPQAMAQPDEQTPPSEGWIFIPQDGLDMNADVRER